MQVKLCLKIDFLKCFFNAAITAQSNLPKLIGNVILAILSQMTKFKQQKPFLKIGFLIVFQQNYI